MLTSLIMLKTKQWHDLLRLRILSWNQHVAICKPYSVTKSKHRDFYRIFKTKTKWQIKVLEHCRFMLWDKRPAKLSISLTVMHHIKFTHHYGGQRWGGGDQIFGCLFQCVPSRWCMFTFWIIEIVVLLWVNYLQVC